MRDGSLSNVQLISKLLVVLSEALAEPKFAHVVARCMEGVADMPLEIGLAARTPSLRFGQSLLAEHCTLSTKLLRVCRGTTISHPGVCPPLLILFCRARSFVLWLCSAHAAVSVLRNPRLRCGLYEALVLAQSPFFCFAQVWSAHVRRIVQMASQDSDTPVAPRSRPDGLPRPPLPSFGSLGQAVASQQRMQQVGHKWVIARVCLLLARLGPTRGYSACAGGSQPAHGRS